MLRARNAKTNWRFLARGLDDLLGKSKAASGALALNVGSKDCATVSQKCAEHCVAIGEKHMEKLN